MSGILFSNFATTQLSAGINPLATAFSVTSTTGALFPTPGAGEWFRCVLVDSLTVPTQREIVVVTVRSGDNFTTVVRAQEGTIAQTWLAGAYVLERLTAGGIADVINYAIANAPGTDPLPDQGGHGGQFLQTDGSNLSWAAAGGGGGITIGDPVSGATPNALLFADDLGNLAQVDSIIKSGGPLGIFGLGSGALSNITSGLHDIAIGVQAGASMDSGTNNVALGHRAMQNSADCQDSIAIGSDTMRGVGAYVGAIAIGSGSLANNAAGGDYNIGIGVSVLANNTTGTENIGMGLEALENMLTGRYNTAIGSAALGASAAGEYNLAIGHHAMAAGDVSGSDNIAVGDDAGHSLVSGNENVFMGLSAGYAVNAGSNNTLIGAGCGQEIVAGSGNVYIGSNVGTGAGDESNTMRLGPASIANVYIAAFAGGGVRTLQVDNNGKVTAV
jgi:hypothetical protein